MKFKVRHNDKESEFPLSPGVYIVGRDPSCDLTLDSTKVSRRHMSCTVDDGEVIVRDLGSRNGIFVSDVQVKEARLQEGDEVKLGDFDLTFTSGTAAGADQGPRIQAVRPDEAEAEEFDEEMTPPADAEALLPAVREGNQPQMLEENGRLYVADPASGRRVEVVPVHAEAAPQRVKARPAGKGGMKHRKLIIGMGIFVILLVVFAIAKQATEPEPQVMSPAQYANMLDEAIRRIEQSEGESEMLKEAGRLIETGRRERPDDQAAHVLRDIAIRWDEFLKDVPGQGYEMERLLRDLKSVHNTRVGLEFVNQYVKLIRRERNYGSNIFAAREFNEAGKHEEALEKLEEIPEDSHYRRKYADLIAETRRKLIEQLKTQVAGAARNGQWSTAAELLQKLADYDPAKAEAYKQQRNAYQSNQEDKEALAQARRRRTEGEYDEALRALKTIGGESPYAAQARNLEATVEAEQRFQRAETLYHAGQGEEALKVLKGDGGTGALALKGRIERVLQAREKALTAKQKGDLEAEREAWLSVTDAETNQRNFYRQEALRELDRFRGRLKALAEDHFARGKALYQESKFTDAREQFQKALRLDPDQELGKDWLDRMSREARLQYLFGVDKKKKGELKAAVKHLDLAVRLGSADDNFYLKARTELKELQKQLK